MITIIISKILLMSFSSSFGYHPIMKQIRFWIISSTITKQTNEWELLIFAPVPRHINSSQTYLKQRPYIQNMPHKTAWVHTVPFVVEHWDVGMKSTKAARVILGVSILLISLRAADIVLALQAEDLWAWTWKGRNLNTTDTVSFFFLFIEKVSCFRLPHFNVLLLVKRGVGREVGATYTVTPTHKHTLSCLHGYHSPEMAKSGPIHFPSRNKTDA